MATRFQLSDQPVIAFVATRDPELAKEFYRDKLGLSLVEEQLPFALVFDAHGTMLRVTIVKDLHPDGYTVLGWKVSDVTAAAKALQNAGIKFERYQGSPRSVLRGKKTCDVSVPRRSNVGPLARHFRLWLCPVAYMAARVRCPSRSAVRKKSRE